MVKTIKTEIKLYAYDELKEDAKNKAFEDYELFLRENPATYEEEDEKGNIIEKFDNMDKWTLKQIKEYVEDTIKINEYLFFENGELANITHYTGNLEKSGKTEFKFLNKVYEVL